MKSYVIHRATGSVPLCGDASAGAWKSAEVAQVVADEMVKGGIQAIWNFAPVKLKVPAHIIVHNEDLYNSLASLSWKLARRFRVPIQEKEAV